MTDYINYLENLIPEKDSLKIVKNEAKKFFKSNSTDECYNMALELYESDNFQIQEVGVLLLGYIANVKEEALDFLYNTVSKHDNWKVQEVFAMAFDNYCSIIGYENSLPIIKEWFKSDNPNVRRAVSEGLRIWTSRPYFKEHPDIAIKLLSKQKNDTSEYARKSIGNAIRDISKKYPELVKKELDTWDKNSKEVLQVYELASKFIN